MNEIEDIKPYNLIAVLMDNEELYHAENSGWRMYFDKESAEMVCTDRGNQTCRLPVEGWRIPSMYFAEALDKVKDGWQVRRMAWDNDDFMEKQEGKIIHRARSTRNHEKYLCLTGYDLEADDWIVCGRNRGQA